MNRSEMGFLMPTVVLGFVDTKLIAQNNVENDSTGKKAQVYYSPGGTYSDWYFPPNDTYSSLEWTFVPVVDPLASFTLSRSENPFP